MLGGSSSSPPPPPPTIVSGSVGAGVGGVEEKAVLSESEEEAAVVGARVLAAGELEEEDAARDAYHANLRAPADSVIRVSAKRNNIHVTVSDLEGRVISRSSGGMVGHKHRERASPEASQACAEDACKKAVGKGYKFSHLEMKGNSAGRGQVLRGILNTGMQVKSIRDTTPVPTPGTRPPAARRL